MAFSPARKSGLWKRSRALRSSVSAGSSSVCSSSSASASSTRCIVPRLFTAGHNSRSLFGSSSLISRTLSDSGNACYSVDSSGVNGFFSPSTIHRRLSTSSLALSSHGCFLPSNLTRRSINESSQWLLFRQSDRNFCKVRGKSSNKSKPSSEAATPPTKPIIEELSSETKLDDTKTSDEGGGQSNSDGKTQNEKNNDHQSGREEAKHAQRKQILFKIRRFLTIVGIPTLIYLSAMRLHESNIVYSKLLDLLREKYTTENGYTKPPSWVMYPLMMWASMIDSHNPDKMGQLWGKFVPLIDAKYPKETRQVGLACLLGMLGGDASTLPPHVFYQKCLKKLQIMEDIAEGMPAAQFLTEIYKACAVGSRSPEVMMMALEVLMTLTQIPAEPDKNTVDLLYKRVTNKLLKDKGGTRGKSEEEIFQLSGVTKKLCHSLLYIYQDPQFCEVFFSENPPPVPTENKRGVTPYVPNFPRIKRVMVQNRALDFAFGLMKKSEEDQSPQIKNSAMMLLLNIVGRYPDFEELMQALGNTEEERNHNKYTIVDALMNMGNDHFMRGQSNEALTAFDEACKLLPGNPTLEYFRGQCLIDLQRIDEAKQVLYKLRSMTLGMFGPQTCMPEALYELAVLNLKYGKDAEDVEEAVDALALLIDRDLLKYCQMKQLDLTDLCYKLENAYEKLGDYQSAHDRLAYVLRKKFSSEAGGMSSTVTEDVINRCTDSALLYECGRMALLTNEYDRSEDYLLRAHELDPMDSHILYHLSLCQLKMHEFEDALENINRVLYIRPNDPNSVSLKLKALTALDRWTDALQFLDSSTLDGSSSSAKTDGSEASKKSERVILPPAKSSVMNQAMYHYERAVILEHLGKMEDAIKEFDSAVRVWSERVRGEGFARYFGRRTPEKRALQKIQLRCERNSGEYPRLSFEQLCERTLQLGLLA